MEAGGTPGVISMTKAERSWSGLRDPFSEAKTRAISALAKEACDAPVSLSSDLVEWCLSDEAEASRLYWRELGRHDVEGRWTETALGFGKT